jgi:ribA/ribD-fused uncharacterized protein
MSTQRVDKFFGEYRYLSNFFNCRVEHDGLSYGNAEAAYQAAKVPAGESRHVFLSASPSEAKRIGRQMAINLKRWEKIKKRVMYEVVMNKFSNPYNVYLKRWLLETGTANLVEGNNWHDNTWGNCICPRCGCVPGENLLGKTLMRVRSELGVTCEPSE